MSAWCTAGLLGMFLAVPCGAQSAAVKVATPEVEVVRLANPAQAVFMFNTASATGEMRSFSVGSASTDVEALARAVADALRQELAGSDILPATTTAKPAKVSIYPDPMTHALFVRSSQRAVYDRLERLVPYWEKALEPVRKARAERIAKALGGKPLEEFDGRTATGQPLPVAAATGEERTERIDLSRDDFVAAYGKLLATLKAGPRMEYHVSADPCTQEVIVRSRAPQAFELVRQALGGR